jgi:hypothetical protein
MQLITSDEFLQSGATGYVIVGDNNEWISTSISTSLDSKDLANKLATELSIDIDELEDNAEDNDYGGVNVYLTVGMKSLAIQ